MLDTVMILGGSSSGKSEYAEEIALRLEKQSGFPVYYLATGTVCDDEFAERVERHQTRRPASWITIEEGHDLARVVRELTNGPFICLVDSIGTWISNLMLEGMDGDEDNAAQMEGRCYQRVHEFIRAWRDAQGTIILVADETGLSVVPEYRLSRSFRDLNGRANQVLAEACERVFLVVAGLPLALKGGGQI